MFMTVITYLIQNEYWLVPLRVIRVIKITKADLQESQTGFKLKKVLYI